MNHTREEITAEIADRLVWHGHHDSTSPLEFLEEPFTERLWVIEHEKPQHEHARRLQLFKRVDLTTFPAEMVNALVDFEEKRQKYNDAPRENDTTEYKEYRESSILRYRILGPPTPEMLAIHAAQCGCGWSEDDTNIFRYKESEKE